MKKKYLAFLLIMSFIIPFAAFAHQGNTDSNGGHNSDNGYHYHHGYPAHQHENGECPYDFDDKTGWNNSGSSTDSNNNENYIAPAKKASNPIVVLVQYLLMFAMYAFIFWAFIMVIIIVIKKEPKKKPVYTTAQYKPKEETVKAISTKSEVKITPKICYAEPIGAVPQQKEERKKTVFVYITKSGNKYHRKNCSTLTGGERRLDVSVAKGLGYIPCSKCNPPK